MTARVDTRLMPGPSHGAAAAVTTIPHPNAVGAQEVGARTIAIVGAGFSGTAVAINLLAQLRGPARIVLVDPCAQPGAGVAYAERDYPYPLNVAAGQMSLDASRPNDFVDFVRTQGIDATSADYLPRQVYGQYLRARFGQASDAAAPAVQCVHHRARALQLRRTADARWDLWLDDGSALRADEVVLALGNPPPACLDAMAQICASH